MDVLLPGGIVSGTGLLRNVVEEGEYKRTEGSPNCSLYNLLVPSPSIDLHYSSLESLYQVEGCDKLVVLAGSSTCLSAVSSDLATAATV